MGRNFSLAVGAVAVAVASVVSGCAGDTTGAAPAAVDASYQTLTLNQHAANMSLAEPYNTIQLTAVARNARGVLIPEAGVATFQATDSSVTVSPSGLVTARYETPSTVTQVIASLQFDDVTRTDTVTIHVTATAPSARIATFSLRPAVGDSAYRAINSGDFSPVVLATDAAGGDIPFNTVLGGDGNIYALQSGDSYTARCFSPNNLACDRFQISDTGHVMLYASSWVYGVTVRDSLAFRVGWEIDKFVVANVPPNSLFTPQTVFIGQGGRINWGNATGDTLDIVFDDPTVGDSALNLSGNYTGRGNIHFLPTSDVFASRIYPVVGTYHFHNPKYPSVVGTLYVEPNVR